jgi:hypothetical protein
LANPLARLAMANIARKSNLIDTSSNDEYLKKTNIKARNKTFKSLDRVADEIRGYKNDIPVNISKQNSKKTTLNNTDKNNLSLKELELLSDAIKGETKIKTNTNISIGRKNTLSLESLAKNIKNNI